ncbi:ATP-grasp domain-containing protein [Maribacter sp. 2307ULW6-5]|uniref:ATP-grasp domain-containing protein n=1 Tax=Maribacter sp. 2307ULW6-5 TaxID=3386275 RepID=UPI0039BD3CAE
MNILISSAGRRVSLVRAFQKELNNLDPSFKVLASDADPQLSAACHVADDCIGLPLVTASDYMDVLIRKCKKKGIKIVVPTIDTELSLLALNRGRFKDAGIELVISDQALIDQCRDKRRIHSFFKSHHVDVAKEYTKDNYQLPMFLKPYDGSRSVDTFLIKKEEDLNEYHRNHERLMFLEYIDHNLYDEFTCDLYYDRQHHLRCAVPRKRIEVRDGEVNKGVTENGYLVAYLRDRMAKVEGAMGCLTAQFFKHKEENIVYGIEINPRFGGGFPLTYLAGANFPKWIIDEYLLNKNVPDAFDCWEDNLMMLRYDDEILVHGSKG